MTALLKTGKLIMYMFFLAFLFNEYILIQEVDYSVVVTEDSLPSGSDRRQSALHKFV